MNNKLSKEDLTNIIKIYKIFKDEEISMMIDEPNLISDDNIKLSLIKLIDNENNVLEKMKYYFDKYTFLTGGKGKRGRKRKSKRSKRKKSKKKRKKKKKKKSGDGSGEGQASNNLNNRNNTSGPVIGNNRVSGSYTGIPNITINNNNNNGTQKIEDKKIPQVSIPLKFVINKDDVNNKNVVKKSDKKSNKKIDKKIDKKKGGTNIEINKSDGLDILKKSLQSGETEFNLTFDFDKDIDYENQDFSNFMGTIKNFVKEKSNDISKNENIPKFKSELKQKINSINNLLPPFYSQDIVLP
tara:strand:+ start:812 stop:1702 length:891 start_codon:yes stop_codon:yes gene_type:complete